jgi:hypothetical protein
MVELKSKYGRIVKVYMFEYGIAMKCFGVILHSRTRTACLYLLRTMYHVSRYGVNELA